jgi:RHS repeat-associated protein
LLNDGSNTYSYDAENRISQVGPAGSTATYVYDAAGQRVRKTSSAGTVDYVYDLAGHEVAEVSSAGAWNRGEVYAGGRHLATYNGGTTIFNHVDWLGTERVRSSLAAMSCETVVSLPFGDGQSTNGSCGDPSPMHFTGKQRDSETNLDYFGARYNASSMGRFMTPDPSPSSGAVQRPQSWNRYAYVYNNPLRHIDPDGQQGVDLTDPNVRALLQALRATKTANSFKGGLIQTIAVDATSRLLGEVFGYNPMAIKGDLSRQEYTLLQKASSYEKGATMIGVGQKNQPGIDAVDITDGTGVSLKEASNIERAKNAAVDALSSATNAGFHDVNVYINAPSVSEQDATNLSKIQNVLGTGVISKVVIFTGNGTVVYTPNAEQQKQIQQQMKCQGDPQKCP